MSFSSLYFSITKYGNSVAPFSGSSVVWENDHANLHVSEDNFRKNIRISYIHFFFPTEHKLLNISELFFW